MRPKNSDFSFCSLAQVFRVDCTVSVTVCFKRIYFTSVFPVYIIKVNNSAGFLALSIYTLGTNL